MNYEKLATDISVWLKDYLTTHKLGCFVVGVSGGIDSAVVSALCAKTGMPTYCFSLPINSHADNNYNAELQLNWLSKYPNVYTGVKDLSSTYKDLSELVSMSDLSKANTKSRLRMVFLYAMAGNTNGLVVGTGNKVEDFGIGFFTKYGDGGVDISPIGDLVKSEVRELGRFLGIPNQIITAAPTDGLWDDNRQDETQIGATYAELEWAMACSDPKSTVVMPLSERQKEVLAIYAALHIKAIHKLDPIPVFKVQKIHQNGK